MNKKFYLVSSIVGNEILFIVIAVILTSCSQSESPKNLVGNWIGVQSVSTRYLDNENNFCFITDSLQVLITIQNDGKVSGHIGNSKFINCSVRRNTGWLGKIFHIGTENGIDGFLTGRFNNHDKSMVKIIKIPFTVVDSTMKGTIFMINNSEMLPLIYTLRLKRM